MMITNQTSVYWTHLTKEEKEQGIHPTKLALLAFSTSTNTAHPKVLRQIERFLIGCRLATTDSDFLAKTMVILQSTLLSLQPIKAVVERVLFRSMPKEITLQKDNHNFYPLSFKNEGFGQPYRDYMDKFATIYNGLIEQKKSYLMHPAHYAELSKYLETEFTDNKLAAERLMTYHCFGRQALEISELERRLKEDKEESQLLQTKMITLTQNNYDSMPDHLELREEDLDCIADEHCRKYVHLIYQALASEGKLGCLQLAPDVLYEYECDDRGNVHPALANFAKQYYQDKRPQYNFGVVVKYLTKLKNHNLDDLKYYCLKSQYSSLDSIIDIENRQLESIKINYRNQLALMTTQSSTYQPGDFTFLSDPLSRRALTHCYQVVNELQAWSFFDEEPPKKTGYMFWDHPTLYKIGHKLDSEGHTGASMTWVMRWMQTIRSKGWQVAVKESLENSHNELGILNRAWSLVDKV